MECTAHKLIADVAILSGGHVLLVKYRDTSRYDGQEGWFLPDDLLAHLEHPLDGARRILKEQVGLSVPEVRLSHIESFGDGAWHLTFHHVADVTGLPSPRASKNVAAAEWFPLDRLPDRSDVAHHGWALDILEEITGGP